MLRDTNALKFVFLTKKRVSVTRVTASFGTQRGQRSAVSWFGCGRWPRCVLRGDNIVAFVAYGWALVNHLNIGANRPRWLPVRNRLSREAGGQARWFLDAEQSF